MIELKKLTKNNDNMKFLLYSLNFTADISNALNELVGKSQKK